jgi:hypothetical protein
MARPRRPSILRWPVLVGGVVLVAVVVVIAILVSRPSSPTTHLTASGRNQPSSNSVSSTSSGSSRSTQPSSRGSGSGSAGSGSPGANQAQACARLPGALSQQMADLLLRVGSNSTGAVTWLRQEANSYHQAAQLVSSGSQLAKALAAAATDMQNLESDLASGKDGPVNGLVTKTSQDLETVYTLCD